MRSGSGAAGWLIGLALGIILAILLAVGGSLGLLAILAAIAGGWRVGHSLAFESGLLVGIGGTWLALLARVAWECPSSDPNGTCFVPDQTPVGDHLHERGGHRGRPRRAGPSAEGSD